MRTAPGDGRQLGAKWLTRLGQGQETPGELAQTHPLLIPIHPEHALPGHPPAIILTCPDCHIILIK